MKPMSKVCDAADWFRPEINAIIRNELREVPRFHRKQWEFAMIFHALRELGLLRPDVLGLSMGGGRELLLYAIAPHVRQLVVTDLYDTQTTWDCAKTNDPDEFIRSGKPFPVDDNKLKALRMDMRALEFEANTFDFCYSSCSIEHIGTHDDFLSHLNEAHRVLKEGGVYVLTTEMGYGNEVIEHQNNYVFSPASLDALFHECNLTPEEEFNANIAPHKINYPTPANFKGLCHAGTDHISTPVFQEFTHVQLLRGKYPYTSGLFILRKGSAQKERHGISFNGLDASRAFLSTGIQEYRHLLDTSAVTPNPFSFLPAEVSPFFSDHASFFAAPGTRRENDRCVFHTDYFWFGSGQRTFAVRLGVRADSSESVVEIRLHRYRTVGSPDVECVKTVHCVLSSEQELRKLFTVDVDENYCYALLATIVSGPCMMERIDISSWAGAGIPERGVTTATVPEPHPAIEGAAVTSQVKTMKHSLQRLLHLS